ncbi:MerR family transcriptional regulator [Cohnella caldifontis]|uniref:MerR family transcriptional regulator n=1 Tax=Cohnella caldifontis TaxID=3027471 RepID=UPI0023EBDB66|nr:MerR family transcriptional regulator [Cohnella sp. YIM B05605]
MAGYLRGQIARMANVNVETLRYYEEEGLLPPPDRSESGYRLYSEEILNRLAFIHNAKSCGFTLKEIKKALTSSGSGQITLDDFLAAIEKKSDKIRGEIAKKEETLNRLTRLKQDLQAEERHPEVKATLRMLRMDS